MVSSAKKVIGGCQILEKLGQGGMGSVYKARQISMDRVVALKILDPIIAKDPEKRERFLKEAKSSAKLHHPNIIGIHSAGYDNGYVYYTMEFIEGGSVADLLKKKGELEEAMVIKIAMQICKGLNHANQSNIIHRDVKPDNFMVGQDGTIKLCDLGLAKVLNDDANMTQEGTFLGTPYYTSPEQVKGLSNIDTRADLYSLGATMYHLATGEPPFKGQSALAILTMHLNDEPAEIGSLNHNLTDRFCDIVMTLLEKDPADRYQTPNDLYADLEELSLNKRKVRKRGHARISQKMAAVAEDDGSYLKPVLFVVVPLILVVGILFMFGGGSSDTVSSSGDGAVKDQTGLAGSFSKDKEELMNSAQNAVPRVVYKELQQIADIYSQAMPTEVESLRKEVLGLLESRAEEYYSNLMESEKSKSLKAIESSEYYKAFLGIYSLLKDDRDEWGKAAASKMDILEDRRKELLELVISRFNRNLLPIDSAVKYQESLKLQKLKQDKFKFIKDFYFKLNGSISFYLQDSKSKEDAYVNSKKEEVEKKPNPTEEVKEDNNEEKFKAISAYLKTCFVSNDIGGLLRSFRKGTSALNDQEGLKDLIDKAYPGLIDSLKKCDAFHKQVHRDLNNIYLGEKIQIDKAYYKVINVEEFDIVVMDSKRQTQKISIDQLPDDLILNTIGKSRSYNLDISYGAGVFSKIKGNDAEGQAFFDLAIKGREQYKNLADQFNKTASSLK